MAEILEATGSTLHQADASYTPPEALVDVGEWTLLPEPCSNISVNCKDCETELASLSQITFLYVHSTLVHLALKYELSMQERLPSIILVPQTVQNRIKMVPNVMLCATCSNRVGSEVILGPQREGVFCFSNDGSYIKCRQFGKHQPKWIDMFKAFPNVEIRKMDNFYGAAAIKIEGCREGKNIIPTVRSTRHSFGQLCLNLLVKDKPRPYQIECFTVAALGNTIVYLPTGAGKTLVAVMLAAHMKKLNPQKLIVFIVDRIPLVFQQGDYLRSQTRMTVLLACGETGSGTSGMEIMAHDAVCCTAQVLINFLDSKRVRMDDISCLIIDEIHHASKNHPYMLLLKSYSRAKRSTRPLLLGLTASPSHGDALGMISKLVNTSKIAQCQYYAPILYNDSLQSSLNRPQFGFSIVQPSTEEQQMKAIVERHVLLVIQKISKSFSGLGELQGPNAENIHECRAFSRQLLDLANSSNNLQAGMIIQHLILVYNSFEMMSVLGVRYARNFLLPLFEEMSKNPVLWTPDEISTSKINCEAIKTFNSISAKVKNLVSILRNTKLDLDSRIIVFVQTKKTARWLYSILNSDDHIKQNWNPAFFVGQGHKTLEGMSWVEEQQPLLNRFRSGFIKLLISTSVLQEGLDVATCNKIILFDRSWSLTSFVQSRGRARHVNSEYIVICSEEEKKFYANLILSETNVLQGILSGIRAKNTLVDKAILICNLCLATEKLAWKEPAADIEDIESAAIDEATLQFKISLHVHNLSDPIHIKENHTVSPDPLFADSRLQRLTINGTTCPAGKQTSFLVQFLNSACLTYNITTGLLDCTLCPFESAFHSQRLFLIADSVSNGILTKPNCFTSTEHHSGSVRININYALMNMDVILGAKDAIWRIVIPFSIIDRFVVYTMKPRSVDSELIIPLLRPAVVFYCKDNVGREFDARMTSEFNMDSLESCNWTKSTVETCLLFNDYPFNNCIWFHFELNPSSQTLLLAGLERLRQSGVIPLFTPKVMRLHEPSIHPQTTALDPEIAYLVGTLRSRCFSLYFSADDVCMLGGLNKRQLLLLTEQLPLMTQLSRFQPVKSLIEQVLLGETVERDTDTNDPILRNSTQIKTIVLTPLRVFFAGFQLMSKNRVTRAFPSHNFIRVQFRDEDLSGKLSASQVASSMADCLKRIGRFLNEGLPMGSATYSFLAMSSSQLREHGCWFVRPFPLPSNPDILVDADYIRKWCGNFSAISNVAKFVARLGQSFSASVQTALIDNPDVTIINDITVERHRKYCFSDGVGMISWGLARKVASRLNRLEEQHMPCAYQIRFAGFKGVVALSPDLADQESEWLQLRPSMKKFESTHKALEILNVADYIPGYMNRQVIMILSGLGVPDAAFSRLHDAQLMSLASMLLETNKSFDALRSYVRSDFMAKLALTSSISYSTEPFFRELLMAVYRKQLSDLLTKSRIFNPQCRILIGTVDETGTLAADEVFIQCTRFPRDLIDHLTIEKSQGSRFVVSGLVAIAKNPCMHPGDIRVLKAVCNPRLELCRWDVVVFPAVGPRPVTDMCSGSDLDGDLYNITWAPELIPPVVDEPMEYDAPPEKKVAAAISVTDMTKFMVDFISNDQLGGIANAHVALVDQLPNGVREPICKTLSVIFSLAVDFPKTGYVATMPEGAGVDSYPDFMLKSERPSYLSDKIIGRMFRKARLAYDHMEPARVLSLDPRFIISPMDASLRMSVDAIYHLYREEIGFVLCRFGIKGESQVLAGSLMDYQMFSLDEDIKDTLKIVSAALKSIMKKTAAQLVALPFHREHVASCAYQAAYSFAIANNPPLGLSSHVLSFAWLLSEELAKIHSTNATVGRSFDAFEQISVGMLSEFQKDAGHAVLLADLIARQEIVDSFGESCVMIGSSSFGLFTLDSDINIYCPNLDALRSDKNVEFANGCASVALSGYSVHIYSVQQEDFYLRRLILQSKDHYLLAWVVAKWARSHRLVRCSAKQQGRLSLSSLLQMCFEYLESAGLMSVKHKVVIDAAYDQWMSLYNALMSVDGSANAMVARCLLGFLQFFSAASISDGLLAKYNVSGTTLVVLREAAFRSFHLLAQSLSVCALWKAESAAGTEAACRKSQIGFVSKRSGAHSLSLFMEGSTRVFFSGSVSSNDALKLDFYQNRRRPQHESIQCYSAVPRLLNFKSDYCKIEYYNHCFRQLIKIGSVCDDAGIMDHPVYGTLKGHLRFGKLYFTHLPRMFLEEGAATIGLLQSALGKSYTSVDSAACKSLFRVSPDGARLEPARVHSPAKSLESEAAPQTVEDLLERQHKQAAETDMASRAWFANKKCRARSAPTASSFEPFVPSAAQMLQFLEKHGFTQKESAVTETLMVSLRLFDATSNSQSSYQLVYALPDTEKPVKVSMRPLRWLCADVRSDTALPDWRFSVVSTKQVASPEHCPRIVEIDPSSRDPVVCHEMRAALVESGMFVRKTRTRVYQPTSISLGSLPAIKDLFDLEFVLSEVTEYDQADPSTGKFQYRSEKEEADLVLRNIRWMECGRPAVTDRLIHAIWAIACSM